jgi:3-deoxy-7-phosphoheptulonate synthase
MSKAAVAAGADALIIEVHPDPDKAASDGRQSLTLEDFARLMVDLRRIAQAVDRSIAPLMQYSPNGHVEMALA